ncbi:hypothetical protein PIB30_058876 [Stylosanthes scabra]|uniref:Uncharacterized protein n=1 Tax=Stylosanthes scabra TaxID=79078 RepID=A0ABU6VMJ6_9FABA|nr:hypothetical protein [Stylosanthes scabra]
MTKILSKPDVYLMNKFLPVSFQHEASTGEDHVTNIQINVFDCGGIAIAFCISHRIMDGGSSSTFFRAWIERINHITLTKPNFTTISFYPEATSHFRDISNQRWGTLLKEGNWITKRFLFGNSALATLKAEITAADDPSKNHQPSRLQIVSALLWKNFMVASKAQCGTQRPCMVTHAVNLRQFMEESLHPENSVGNFIWICTAEHTGEEEVGLDELISKLKNSIQHVDRDLVARFRRYEDASSILEDDVKNVCSKTMDEGFETFGFTSWYNFGAYELDFGWGKPIWVSTTGLRNTLPCLNMIVLLETRFRDGIEAWVTIEEEKMKHLESCPDLLTYATLDPSPLTMGSSAGSNSKSQT